MTGIKHIGIYVKCLEKEVIFYREAFKMMPICENVVQKDELVHNIFNDNTTEILITKLITQQGKSYGIGDMIELLQVKSAYKVSNSISDSIFCTGCMHIGFGVQDIDNVVELIKKNGGSQQTLIHLLNEKNKCCMCRDPEGNWLELIENL